MKHLRKYTTRHVPKLVKVQVTVWYLDVTLRPPGNHRGCRRLIQTLLHYGKTRQFGEDVSELLEFVPARFKVIRIVRPKLSCAECAHIVKAPAPGRPIDRGLAGPGLLAHVLVSKYSDHLPLYRQAGISHSIVTVREKKVQPM